MAEKLDTKLTVRTNSTTKKQFADKAKANGTTPTARINHLLHDYVSASTTSTNKEDSTTSIDNYTTSTNNEDTNPTQQETEARLSKLESYLDGLSCSLPENIPSEIPLKATKEDKPYHLSLNEDTPPEEVKNDQSENKTQKADKEGLTATELAGVLDIPKGYITNWKKGKNIPSAKSKYHSAYQEWLKWELKGGKWQKATS